MSIKYILPKHCFTPEKISKYTGIGDFIGLVKQVQVPGLGRGVGLKLGFYLGEGVVGLVNNYQTVF